jgi:hypothetical protein
MGDKDTNVKGTFASAWYRGPNSGRKVSQSEDAHNKRPVKDSKVFTSHVELRSRVSSWDKILVRLTWGPTEV